MGLSLSTDEQERGRMGKICTFFGHRDTYLDDEEKAQIRACLINLIEKEGVDAFWFGSYGNFDSACAGITRSLKKEYPHIEMHLLLPYPTKNDRAGGASYDELEFDSFSYFDPDKLLFPKFAISKRNDYMAKNCDFMICYVICGWGGAFQAMQKAIRSKKTVFNFAPKRAF